MVNWHHLDELGEGIESLDIRLTINNLFDESYAGTIAPGAFWIGVLRTAAINVRLTFQIRSLGEEGKASLSRHF